MPTNVTIDDRLLNEAMRLGEHRTKRATVNEALSEYIQYRKRLKEVRSFSTIDFDPEYDYKAARGKR